MKARRVTALYFFWNGPKRRPVYIMGDNCTWRPPRFCNPAQPKYQHVLLNKRNVTFL